MQNISLPCTSLHTEMQNGLLQGFWIRRLAVGKNKGKKNLQHQITNNKKVTGLKDMLKF